MTIIAREVYQRAMQVPKSRANAILDVLRRLVQPLAAWSSG